MLTSVQNPKIKSLVNLKERRERDRTGTFLIEGFRELSAAKGLQFLAIYTCPEFYLGSNEEALLEAFEAPIFEVSPAVFRKISYRDRPDGLIGVAQKMQNRLSDLVDPRFLVIAQAIEKPGNLGTILRSADAAGASGVLVVDRCTDIYNPNVVRASVGTLFTQPVIECTSGEALSYLKEHGFTTYAATPSASLSYREVSFAGRVAIAVGTEQLGLSAEWMALNPIQIPMYGQANSLNVATATTLLLYEVAHHLHR